MTGFQAVQYVGGGLSLVAFVVAAIFYSYREWLRGEADKIRSAPVEDRLKAIAAVSNFFVVDVSHLPIEEQAKIVLVQIHLRSRRDILICISFISIAAICGAIAILSITYNSQGASPPKPVPAAKCDDNTAQYPESEQTRVGAFTYHASDHVNPGPRFWSRPTPDSWIEKSDGRENFFSVQKRVSFGNCDGTVVTKLGDPNFQLLITDKNCITRGLLFRRLPSCEWTGLPPMEDVK